MVPRGAVLLLDLGRSSYGDVHRLMLGIVDKRIGGEVGDVLIVVEHDHVYTIGRRGSESNVLENRAPVYRVERGGDVTYHGPGMLVAYPIMRLEGRGLDVKMLVRMIEEVVIRSLGVFGVSCGLREGYPGVWVGGRKIASIGLALKKWVTYHGVAVNISPDMSFFEAINPCGLPPQTMTSLSREIGREVGVEEYKPYFLDAFSEVFSTRLISTRVEILEDKSALARIE